MRKDNQKKENDETPGVKSVPALWDTDIHQSSSGDELWAERTQLWGFSWFTCSSDDIVLTKHTLEDIYLIIKTLYVIILTFQKTFFQKASKLESWTVEVHFNK